MSGIERVTDLPASPEEVWAALTQPDRLSAWFGAVAVEAELRPGGRITFERGGTRWRGLVEAVDPPRRFAFRWVGPAALDERPRTRVEFELEPRRRGTRLLVRETPLWPRDAGAARAEGAAR